MFVFIKPRNQTQTGKSAFKVDRSDKHRKCKCFRTRIETCNSTASEFANDSRFGERFKHARMTCVKVDTKSRQLKRKKVGQD
jgi:hypothetical protein